MMFSYNDDALDVAIDLTPLLDIIFILLIFFVVTASFSKTLKVDVSLPISETASISDEERPQSLVITHDGQLFLDDLAVDKSDLAALLALDKGRPLLFSVDKKSSFEYFIYALEQAQKNDREDFAIHVKE